MIPSAKAPVKFVVRRYHSLTSASTLHVPTYMPGQPRNGVSITVMLVVVVPGRVDRIVALQAKDKTEEKRPGTWSETKQRENVLARCFQSGLSARPLLFSLLFFCGSPCSPKSRLQSILGA
jgi:hypothetical protein